MSKVKLEKSGAGAAASGMTPEEDSNNAAAIYAQAVAFQAMDARRQARSNRWRDLMLGASIVVNVALAGSVAAMGPSKSFVPMFGFLNEAGLYDWTSVYSDLPASTQVAGIESVMWNYLKCREGFAPSEADVCYDIVSKLSSQGVQQQYQGNANTKFNPQAPAVLLGPEGFIRINRMGAHWISHAEDYSTGVYEIHFCRTVVRKDIPPGKQRMEETITYQMVDGVPLDQRLTFNPAGLMVTEYPTAREEGAPGVADPCK